MAGVLVVGSLNLDHAVQVSSLPEPGATVTATGYWTGPGGKGLNQAIAAARQGARVAMVGAVGGDAAGERLLVALDTEGVERQRGVTVVAGSATGTALVTVAEAGTNTIVVAPGANGVLGRGFVESAIAAIADDGPPAAVLTQLEVPEGAVRAALERGRACGAVTVLNPAPAGGSLDAGLLSLVDFLVPNEGEALALTGSPDAAAAVLALVGHVGRGVIVTLGSRGALWARRPGDGASRTGGEAVVETVPPFKVEAVDATAAGDAFCGALVAGIAGGLAIEEALRRASAAGALAATARGAVASLPRSSDVDRLLADAAGHAHPADQGRITGPGAPR